MVFTVLEKVLVISKVFGGLVLLIQALFEVPNRSLVETYRAMKEIQVYKWVNSHTEQEEDVLTVFNKVYHRVMINYYYYKVLA